MINMFSWARIPVHCTRLLAGITLLFAWQGGHAELTWDLVLEQQEFGILYFVHTQTDAPEDYDLFSHIGAKAVIAKPGMYGGTTIQAHMTPVPSSGLAYAGPFFGFEGMLPITGYFAAVDISNLKAPLGLGLYAFDWKTGCIEFNPMTCPWY